MDVVTSYSALRLTLLFSLFSIVTGNGYIEGKELENFFQELEKARKGSGMVSLCSTPMFGIFCHLDLSRLENILSQDASRHLGSLQSWQLRIFHL